MVLISASSLSSSELSSVAAATTTTRWQAFRQQHRHRPLKLAMYLVAGSIVCFFYVQIVFLSQSDRSYANISSWNAQLQVRHEIMLREQLDASSEDDFAADPLSSSTVNSSIQSSSSNGQENYSKRSQKSGGGLWNLFVLYMFISLMISYLRTLVPTARVPSNQGVATDYYHFGGGSGSGGNSSSSNSIRETSLFYEQAQRINWQRLLNGQRPLPLETLRQLMLEDTEIQRQPFEQLQAMPPFLLPERFSGEGGGVATEALAFSDPLMHDIHYSSDNQHQQRGAVVVDSDDDRQPLLYEENMMLQRMHDATIDADDADISEFYVNNNNYNNNSNHYYDYHGNNASR